MNPLDALADENELEKLFKLMYPPQRQVDAIYKAQLETFFPEPLWIGFRSKNNAEQKALRALPMDFNTQSELKAYLESVRKSPFVVKNWGPSLPKPTYYLGSIHPKRGLALEDSALYDPAFTLLAFSQNGLSATKQTALHEFAHFIIHKTFPWEVHTTNEAGHNPKFARVFIMLVEEFLSKELADTLEAKIILYGGEIADSSQVHGDVGGWVDA